MRQQTSEVQVNDRTPGFKAPWFSRRWIQNRNKRIDLQRYASCTTQRTDSNIGTFKFNLRQRSGIQARRVVRCSVYCDTQNVIGAIFAKRSNHFIKKVIQIFLRFYSALNSKLIGRTSVDRQGAELFRVRLDDNVDPINVAISAAHVIAIVPIENSDKERWYANAKC